MSRLPLCTAEEFNAAVQSARDAFPKWRATPVPQRARVMLKLQVGRCAGALGGVLSVDEAVVWEPAGLPPGGPAGLCGAAPVDAGPALEHRGWWLEARTPPQAA